MKEMYTNIKEEFHDNTKLFCFLESNFERIYSIRYCCSLGNSHDEDFEFKVILIENDTKLEKVKEEIECCSEGLPIQVYLKDDYNIK